MNIEGKSIQAAFAATVPMTTISLDGHRYYVLDQYTIMEV